MRFMKTAIVVALALLGTSSVIHARDLEKKTVTVASEGAKRLAISFDFGAGEIHLAPAAQDAAATFDMSYDNRYYDNSIDYEVVDGTGELDIASSHEGDNDIDTEKNIWDVTLSDKYPAELKLDFGACDAEIELGGIPLEQLDINIGAASANIDFSRPNPGKLERIKFKTGASSIKMTDIGNAHFKVFDFEGGVGSYDLDFRGEYSGESEIKLEIGLGSADIVLPKGVACRVETESGNFLSSVDFHGGDLDEISDDRYETPDFDRAKDRVIVYVEVGLGSVDIYFK